MTDISIIGARDLGEQLPDRLKTTQPYKVRQTVIPDLVKTPGPVTARQLVPKAFDVKKEKEDYYNFFPRHGKTAYSPSQIEQKLHDEKSKMKSLISVSPIAVVIEAREERN